MVAIPVAKRLRQLLAQPDRNHDLILKWSQWGERGRQFIDHPFAARLPFRHHRAVRYVHESQAAWRFGRSRESRNHGVQKGQRERYTHSSQEGPSRQRCFRDDHWTTLPVEAVSGKVEPFLVVKGALFTNPKISDSKL